MSRIDDKQIVFINSSDRTSGTDGNFTFSINLRPDNNFDRVTVLEAGIPKSFYSVQTGENTFTLTEGIASATITLPIGNYTRSSLKTELAALLVSSSPNSWTYAIAIPNQQKECDNGHYTFTVTGNTSQPSFSFNSTTSLAEMMGFNNSLTYTFSANRLESVNVTNLQPFQAVNIHSNLVSPDYAQGVNTDILATIICNTGQATYSNVGYICPDVEAFSRTLASGATSVATFTLTDEQNTLLDLNGVNCQLVLCFWQKNQSLRLLGGGIKSIVALIEHYLIPYYDYALKTIQDTDNDTTANN